MLATVGNIFHCPTFDFPTIDILNEIFYAKFDFLNISIVLIQRKNRTVNGFQCIIYINCFSFSFSIYITVKWCSNKVVIPLMIMKISFLVFFARSAMLITRPIFLACILFAQKITKCNFCCVAKTIFGYRIVLN